MKPSLDLIALLAAGAIFLGCPAPDTPKPAPAPPPPAPTPAEIPVPPPPTPAETTTPVVKPTQVVDEVADEELFDGFEEEEDPSGGFDTPPDTAVEIDKRGSEARRKAFREAIAPAKANLARAKKLLAERTKKAADPESALGAYELGSAALKAGRFDEAAEQYARAAELDEGYATRIPQVDDYRHFTHVFRGKHTRKDGTSEIVWTFDPERPQETRDFDPIHKVIKAEQGHGSLELSATTQFLILAARVRGRWEDHATLRVVLATTTPEPWIGFETEGGNHRVVFGKETRLYPGLYGNEEAVATSETRALPGTEVALAVQAKGERAKVTVSIAGEAVIEHEVPAAGTIQFTIGARGAGTARFDAVTCVGRSSEIWTQATLASAPTLIARKLREHETKKQAEASGVDPIPVAYRRTSAEDAVGLEGIPERWTEAVAEGRRLLAEERAYEAGKKFEEAARYVEFHAGAYLHALGKVRSDPDQALLRLDQCVARIDDFYEAHTARATALASLTRYDEAETALKKATALRPDYAPIYAGLANLRITEGRYAEALEALQLAAVLGPGDPNVAKQLAQVTALAAGPTWAVSTLDESAHYRLSTDLAGQAARLGERLETLRAWTTKTFPVLVNPKAPPRKALVLVFSEPVHYYEYSERTGVGRFGDLLAYYNQWSRQLVAAIPNPEDWSAFHLLHHGLAHQWGHGQGLDLPPWFSEGLGEYVAGVRVSEDGSAVEATGQASKIHEKRLRSLTGNWAKAFRWQALMTEGSGQFYSGPQDLKHGQAWSMLHFILESKDAKLRETLDTYLKRFTNEKKEEKSDAELEYTFVETFHQLDIKDLERRWKAWVTKLAKRSGIEWTAPDTAEERKKWGLKD